MNSRPSFTCEFALTASETGSERLISFLEHQISSGNWANPDDFAQVNRYMLGEGASLPGTHANKVVDEIRKRTLDHLMAQGFDRAALAIWFQGRVHDLREQGAKRSNVEHESQTTFRKAGFVRIAAGPVLFPLKDRFGNDAPVVKNLPYDFEVMDIPVTQAMWAEVMGSLPDGALDPISEENILKTVVNGREFRMAPDFPVSGVHLVQAILFANEISRKRGMRPAYTDLVITPGEQDRVEITPSQFNGDRFTDLEGFRLPSYAEWCRMYYEHYLRVKTLSSFKSVEDHLHLFGASRNQSGGLLQEVGSKLPFVFDGRSVYDLFGLVYQFVHEVSIEDSELTMVPTGEITRRTKMYGGSFKREAQTLSRAENAAIFRADIDSRLLAIDREGLLDVGLRLVRTVPR